MDKKLLGIVATAVIVAAGISTITISTNDEPLPHTSNNEKIGLVINSPNSSVSLQQVDEIFSEASSTGIGRSNMYLFWNIIEQKKFGQPYNQPLIIDLDNDNTQDLLISRIGKTLRFKYVFDNFDNYALVDTIFNSQFTSLYGGDVNVDGLEDLIVFDPPGLFWLENLGNGQFVETATLISGNLLADSLFIVDLDGDNDMDIISIDYASGISWQRNTGNGTFDPTAGF